MKTRSFSLFALMAALLLSFSLGAFAFAATSVENDTLEGKRSADFKRDSPKMDKKVQTGGPGVEGPGSGVANDSLSRKQADFNDDGMQNKETKRDKKVQTGGPGVEGPEVGVKNDSLSDQRADFKKDAKE